MELRRWTLEPKKPILLSNIMDKPHQLSIVLYITFSILFDLLGDIIA